MATNAQTKGAGAGGRAANALRLVIVNALSEAGVLTVVQVAEIAGCDRLTARNYLCRLVKGGVAKAERLPGSGGRSALVRYHFRNEFGGANCAEPKQAFLKDYPPNQVRDPYALPEGFFPQLRRECANQTQNESPT